MNNLNHKYLDVYERIDDETISQKLKLYNSRDGLKSLYFWLHLNIEAVVLLNDEPFTK